MKIRTRGRQVFNVPNTREGHVFLQLLRKFRNRRWHYRARGRGPRREHGDKYSIPQENAEWLAVYMRPKEGQYLPNVAPRRRGLTNEFRGSGLAEGVLCGCDYAAGFRCPIHNQVPVFQPPRQIMEAKIAEWSSPFIEGSPVAISVDGMVYNSAPHGLQPYSSNIGFAVSNSEGAIGEGEGIVHVQLTAFPPVEPIPWPQPQNDDTIDLTPDEQGLLDEILESYFDVWAGQIDEGKQALLDKLMEKLID